VRPSIKALGEQVAQVKGLVAGQFSLLEEFTDLWVKGEFVPNPDNKPDEDWKTWKFLRVYANQGECEQAANEQFGNGNKPDETPVKQSAEDAAKATLIPFLTPLWKQAKTQAAEAQEAYNCAVDGGETPDEPISAEDAMAELLKVNPLLAKAFTMESLEVQTLIGATTEDEKEEASND